MFLQEREVAKFQLSQNRQTLVPSVRGCGRGGNPFLLAGVTHGAGQCWHPVLLKRRPSRD